MNRCSLVVESCYPDLVINVGEVTLGEENRKKLQKIQRDQEKVRVTQAACALLNSGGGVIWMKLANNDEHLVEMGLDLEKSLRELVPSPHFEAFFETKQEGRCFYIFVKSWSSDISTEDSSVRPRICSLSSSLYRRSGTSVFIMDSRNAFDFLKAKRRDAECEMINDFSPPSKMSKTVYQNSSEFDLAFEIFQTHRLEYGQILPFPESQFIEFKQFSTKHIQEYVKNTIPEYVPAFANTGGGYLFIGVDDKSKKVLGCAKENVDPSSLESVIAGAVSKLPVVHFCSSKPQVGFKTKIIDVFRMGELYGYFCVIKVEQFCCAVFSQAPNSWMVKDMLLCCLTAEEWVQRMMYVDPVEKDQGLAEAFESQLNLSHRPPLCRPVYCRKGLEYKAALQQQLFPVPPEHLQYTPESLWKELSAQHQGLEELINKQMHPFSQGILILSRSWAVDLNLQGKQTVICDGLLVALNSPPVLYTILGEQDAEGQDYCTRTAFTLKQKLVNTGGYTGRVCVMTKVLHLSPGGNPESLEDSHSAIDYPMSYNLANTKEMEALLQSLVIVLLSFRSFLSDQVGYEILNLLTAKQYELFSKNLDNSRELFIHGLPGSGKTIMAMKIIEKIRNTFKCKEDRILYVCENQLLRNFISNKKICQAVTRKTFMRNVCEKIEHIIIDEAQNFRLEDGDWYKKAKNISQRKKDCPGILWIFLDYFQTTHLTCTGLPPLSAQYPKEELTTVVRNATPIARFLQQEMQMVKGNPPRNFPREYLEILHKSTWVLDVPGNLETENLDLENMVIYVAEKCQYFLRNGYSPKDIIVLFSTTSEVEEYKDKFLTAMRKRTMSQINDAPICGDDMFDSVRRFSGLERNIVFGINPRAEDPTIFHNLLLCLASRARKHLFILQLSYK